MHVRNALLVLSVMSWPVVPPPGAESEQHVLLFEEDRAGDAPRPQAQ